jgi:hypothetical protein
MLWEIDEHATLFIEPNTERAGAGRITLAFAEPPTPRARHLDRRKPGLRLPDWSLEGYASTRSPVAP